MFNGKNQNAQVSRPKAEFNIHSNMGMFAQIITHKGQNHQWKDKENAYEDTNFGRDKPQPMRGGKDRVEEIRFECDEVLVSPRPDKNNEKSTNKRKSSNMMEKEHRRINSNAVDYNHRIKDLSQLNLMCNQQFSRDHSPSPGIETQEEKILEKVAKVLSKYQEENMMLKEQVAYLQSMLSHH